MKAAHVVPVLGLLGLLLGPANLLAIRYPCSDLCSCTASCSAVCQGDNGVTTCGDYGLCAGSYGCMGPLVETGHAALADPLLDLAPAVARPSAAGTATTEAPRPVPAHGSTLPADPFRPLCGLASAVSLTRSTSTPTQAPLKLVPLASDWCVTDPNGPCCSAYQCCHEGLHGCCIYYNTYCF